MVKEVSRVKKLRKNGEMNIGGTSKIAKRA